MRRPLCLFSLIYFLILLVLLQISPPEREDFSDYHKDNVVLEGTVVSKEFKTASDGSEYLIITLRNVSVEGWESQPRGKVQCRAGDGTKEDARQTDDAVRMGARISLRGRLYVYAKATNDGEFDAALYYQILGYTSFQLQSAELTAAGTSCDGFRDALYQGKRYLSDILRKCLTEEDASVMRAMLLGERGTLSAQTKALYQDSGIIHILAISGLHISVIGMGLYRLLRKMRLPLPVSAAAAVIIMLLYGQMTGLNASSFRAIVMFLLRMASLILRRTYDLLTALSLAGLLLLVQQPLYLYHAGFLFSFSAVLGIALLAPAFETKGMKALSVTLATLPVYLICYSTFPLYSVILNLMVLPLVSTVMVSGLAVLALGMLYLPAAAAVGTIPHMILLFYKAICSAVAVLPGHSVNLGAPARWQLVAYIGILALIPALRTAGRLSGIPRGRASRMASFLPELYRILCAAAAVLVLCLRVHTGLSLHVIDVGQGDALLLRCRDMNLLIDGGSTDHQEVAEYQLSPLLQYYGISRLDYCIVTHPDADHMNGILEVIRESRTHRGGLAGILTDDAENGITIGTLCLPSAAGDTWNGQYEELFAAAREKNIPVMFLKEGDTIEGERLRLLCLHPEAESSYGSSNEMSVTLYLQYGNFTALLTGDLEGEGEERLLEYVSGYTDGIPLTLLKVAHHGSSGATSEAFLQIFRPRLAVISCGVDNSYGHPHAETLERLKEAGVQTVYDTRTGGEITFHTNRRTLHITQRGGDLASG